MLGVAPRSKARRITAPKNAVQHAAIIDARHSARFVGRSGAITRHSKSVRSYRLMHMLNQISHATPIPLWVYGLWLGSVSASSAAAHFDRPGMVSGAPSG